VAATVCGTVVEAVVEAVLELEVVEADCGVALVLVLVKVVPLWWSVLEL
jgi:hypothetical protein